VSASAPRINFGALRLEEVGHLLSEGGGRELEAGPLARRHVLAEIVERRLPPGAECLELGAVGEDREHAVGLG
jgi:hypothetical protein